MSGQDGEPIAVSLAAAARWSVAGRPMISLQGRAITRALVKALRVEAPSWRLDIVEVDYFDRDARAWERRRDADEYCGRLDDDPFSYLDDGAGRRFYEINGGGVGVLIGPSCDDPWRTLFWPHVFGSQFVKPGILGW